MVISSFGMLTSVGHDGGHSCAAIRAGITRPNEIDYFEVLDPKTQDLIPLIGHPIHGFGEGFNLAGFWRRVGKACFLDLVERGKLPVKVDFWRATGLIVIGPYLNDDRFQGDGSDSADSIKEAWLPLIAELNVGIQTENVHAVCIGQTGLIAALRLSRQLISTNHLERVIVMAVDSYLDTLTLEWLAQSDRLKTPGNGKGLMPGEAGACLLIESPHACAARRGTVLARVEATGLSKEPNHFFSEEPNMGRGLASAINEALSGTSIPMPFSDEIITNLNGEDWRAIELAGAKLILQPAISSNCQIVSACESTGDTGAASAVVSAVLAVWSFLRRYAKGGQVLILMSTEHGDTGAALLKRAI